MTTQDKLTPANVDTDVMTFGRYEGQSLQDVPASYLSWLKDSMESEGYSKKSKWRAEDPKFIRDKILLYNYIYNSWDAIKMELKGK